MKSEPWGEGVDRSRKLAHGGRSYTLYGQGRRLLTPLGSPSAHQAGLRENGQLFGEQRLPIQAYISIYSIISVSRVAVNYVLRSFGMYHCVIMSGRIQSFVKHRAITSIDMSARLVYTKAAAIGTFMFLTRSRTVVLAGIAALMF